MLFSSFLFECDMHKSSMAAVQRLTSMLADALLPVDAVVMCCAKTFDAAITCWGIMGGVFYSQ